MLGRILGCALAASACACSSEAPPPPPPPLDPAPTTAPDELAPGEISEGPHAAFGLPIPASLTIDIVTPGFIRARGQATLEDVATYVRARVDAEQVVTGPTKTVFDNATVKQPRPAPPVEANTVLYYEVASAEGFTTLVARREPRTKVPEGLTEAERWARSGMRPDGKPLDPKKFE